MDALDSVRDPFHEEKKADRMHIPVMVQVHPVSLMAAPNR